ncbi:MAG: rhomboid family intramembrane serine protease [Actinobacteria bacterium]|nr:rhomboid family intramembrane serine protease [Actinomycetota bacterium]
MSVERKCDCGAMMGAYDLGCKICGKSFKVRDEFLVGKDILPEPPVGLWAAQQREAASKKKSWTRKPAPRPTTPRNNRSTSRGSTSISTKYNFSTILLLALSVIAVILFREPLTAQIEALPYSILAVTLLISFIALRNSDFFGKIVMSPTHVFHNKEYYRLISSGFGHINAGHFILNAIGLINFGPFLMEFLRGAEAFGANAPLAFLLIYLSAIVVADLPDLIRHKHNPEYSSVGASGAIAAVVAGAAISDPNLEVILFFIPGLALPGFVYAIGYLAISIYLDYRGNGRVAHLAHAAGTIYGLAVVAIISSIFTIGFASSLSANSTYESSAEVPSDATKGDTYSWAPSGFDYTSTDSSFAYSFYGSEEYYCSDENAQGCIKLQIASEQDCTQLAVKIRFYDSQTGEEEWAEDQLTYFSGGVPQDVELSFYSRAFDRVDPPEIYCSIP